MELDAIPHVLLAVRASEESPQLDLPAELAASTVQVAEEQVPALQRIM